MIDVLFGIPGFGSLPILCGLGWIGCIIAAVVVLKRRPAGWDVRSDSAIRPIGYVVVACEGGSVIWLTMVLVASLVDQILALAV